MGQADERPCEDRLICGILGTVESLCQPCRRAYLAKLREDRREWAKKLQGKLEPAKPPRGRKR